MSITRVKICGITRPEDAAVAAENGVDSVGLNFFQGPRKIEPQNAREIIRQLPPLVTPIALVSGNRSEIPTPYDIYKMLRIFVFQIYAAKSHWDFYENECEYWLVSHVRSRDSLTQLAVDWASWPNPTLLGEGSGWVAPETRFGQKPSAFVLDTAYGPSRGGTGQSFNWNWIAEAREAGELEGLPPIILAGGLTPENVAEAIRIARPYAVDVSSGVEVAGKPGVKDPIKMRDFIQAAKGAV